MNNILVGIVLLSTNIKIPKEENPPYYPSFKNKQKNLKEIQKECSLSGDILSEIEDNLVGSQKWQQKQSTTKKNKKKQNNRKIIFLLHIPQLLS